MKKRIRFLTLIKAFIVISHFASAQNKVTNENLLPEQVVFQFSDEYSLRSESFTTADLYSLLLKLKFIKDTYQVDIYSFFDEKYRRKYVFKLNALIFNTSVQNAEKFDLFIDSLNSEYFYIYSIIRYYSIDNEEYKEYLSDNCLLERVAEQDSLSVKDSNRYSGSYVYKFINEKKRRGVELRMPSKHKNYSYFRKTVRRARYSFRDSVESGRGYYSIGGFSIECYEKVSPGAIFNHNENDTESYFNVGGGVNFKYTWQYLGVGTGISFDYLTTKTGDSIRASKYTSYHFHLPILLFSNLLEVRFTYSYMDFRSDNASFLVDNISSASMSIRFYIPEVKLFIVPHLGAYFNNSTFFSLYSFSLELYIQDD